MDAAYASSPASTPGCSQMRLRPGRRSLVLGIPMNTVSRNRKERSTMTPVATLRAALSLLIARASRPHDAFASSPRTFAHLVRTFLAQHGVA
jgi:hypothetical protein